MLKIISNRKPAVIGRELKIIVLTPDNNKQAFVEVMFSSSVDQHIAILTEVQENTAT